MNRASGLLSARDVDLVAASETLLNLIGAADETPGRITLSALDFETRIRRALAQAYPDDVAKQSSKMVRDAVFAAAQTCGWLSDVQPDGLVVEAGNHRVSFDLPLLVFYELLALACGVAANLAGGVNVGNAEWLALAAVSTIPAWTKVERAPEDESRAKTEIQVLSAMETPRTVVQLAEATGQPIPAVLRCLVALRSRGLVSTSPAQGTQPRHWRRAP